LSVTSQPQKKNTAVNAPAHAFSLSWLTHHLRVARRLDALDHDRADREQPAGRDQRDDRRIAGQVRRDELERSGRGRHGAADHEQGRRDQQRPSGEETEHWPEGLVDPGVGGASVGIHPVKLPERERDAEHDHAAVQQARRREHADRRNQRRGRGRGAERRRGARDPHDHGLAEAERILRETGLRCHEQLLFGDDCL
jgi:hypothetical protein